jgi:hypothetical protein
MGQLFEKGVPVQPVSEMNIADNHLKLWPRLVEVANDPYPSSSARYPSLVFRDVAVSGIGFFASLHPCAFALTLCLQAKCSRRLQSPHLILYHSRFGVVLALKVMLTGNTD